MFGRELLFGGCLFSYLLASIVCWDEPKPRKYSSCFTAMYKFEMAHKTEGRIVERVLMEFENFGSENWDKDDKKIVEIAMQIRTDRLKETNSSTIFYHPVDLLHFVKRVVLITNPFLQDYEKVLKRFDFSKLKAANKKNNFDEDIKNKIIARKPFYDLFKKLQTLIQDTRCWPEHEDYEKTLASFAHLTKIYSLNKSQLADGNIKGKLSIHKMTIEDILDTFEIYDKYFFFDEIIQWCEFLLANENKELTKDLNSYLRRIHRTLANNYYKAGDVNKAIDLLENLIKKGESDKKYQADLDFFKGKKTSNTLYPKGERNYNRTYNDIYESLCRMQGKQPNLRCIYHRPMNGWYAVKQEFISLRPPIHKFYNVISSNEARILQELAKPRIAFAYSNEKDFHPDIPGPYQPVESGWLNLNLTILHELEQRITFITGLNAYSSHNHLARITPESESFQVTNFGLAFKQPKVLDNMDLERQRPWLSSHIATWRFELYEEELIGGDTVFPEIGITALNTPHSALFWYSNLRNGKRDERVKHASCPLIYGSKWVSNKWIHDKNLFLKRPCTKNKKV